MKHSNTLNHLQKADIETFNKDGVVCLKGAIRPQEIDLLRSDVHEMIKNKAKSQTSYDFENLQQQFWSGEEILQAGESDRFDLQMYKLVLDTDPDARPIRDQVSEEGNGSFFYDAGQWRFHDGIKTVALNSSLPEISAQLMDSEYINFWEDTTFVKAPHTSQRTTFHQDWAYFQINGEKCCIVWIPLDRVTKANGAMEYIRGSHLWDKTYAPNLLISQSIDPTSPYEKLPDIEGSREDYDIISFDVEPGDVIIHHVKTIHGSGGNTSADAMRRAIAFRYCGDDIRYFDKPGAIEQPYISTKLKNGAKLTGSDYPLAYQMNAN